MHYTSKINYGLALTYLLDWVNFPIHEYKQASSILKVFNWCNFIVKSDVVWCGVNTPAVMSTFMPHAMQATVSGGYLSVVDLLLPAVVLSLFDILFLPLLVFLLTPPLVSLLPGLLHGLKLVFGIPFTFLFQIRYVAPGHRLA